jgi:hypothetical protein
MPKIINKDNTDFLSTSFADEDDQEIIEHITMEEYNIIFKQELDTLYPIPIYSDYERNRIELDIDFLVNKNYHLMTSSSIKNYMKINEANIIKSENKYLYDTLYEFFSDKIYCNYVNGLILHIKTYINSLLDSKQKIKMFYDSNYSPIVIKSAKFFIYKLLLDSSSRKKYVFKDAKFRI